MKIKFKHFLFLTFFALLTFTSCQDETIEVDNPNNQETIVPNSTLANLILNATANDGALDDILDNANCISVNLPVTVVVNDITITINTLDDLELITQIFNEFENDDDILEFLFPITIILNDYTEIYIENEEQLASFVEDCTQENEVIECVDFQYPISFSLYNADFQITETVTIENDEELYLFLQGLENPNGGIVLASLNFPVTLVYANGNTLEVNNNQELEEAINAAEDDCDDVIVNDCSVDDVAMYLQECFWRVVAFNGDDNYIQYEFHFNSNGTLEIIDGNTTAAIGGNWNMSVSNDGLPEIVISDLTAFSDDLEGSWIVVECAEDRFELIRTVENTTTTVVIEQECETNTQDCNQEVVNNNLSECIWNVVNYNGSNNYINFNLDFNGNNSAGSITNNNGFVSDFAFSSETTNEGLVLTMDVVLIGTDIEIINGNWLVVECDSDRIVLVNTNTSAEMVLEQNCDTVVNDCDFGEVQSYLMACPQIPTLNGFTPSFTYFEFQNTNQLFTLYEGDLAYNGTWDIAMIDGEITVFVTFNGLDDFNGEYIVVECGPDQLILQQGDKELILTKECFDENPFECFSNTEYVICDNLEPFNDGIATVDLYEIFPNCANDNVEIAYYETMADAETQVNQLASPYTNISVPQTLYARVTLAGTDTFDVFEVTLVIENCDENNCTEEQIDTYLLECHWNVVNYNGSNDLIIYNLDFEAGNGVVVIYNNEVTIDASWSTSQNNDGVWIEFGNINGANIQAISGNWLVVECNEERLELVKNNDVMVIERDCN